MACIRWALVLLVSTSFGLASVCDATTFQPQTLGKLLAPTSAIVLADFLGSQAVSLEDGTVATEAYFRIEKEWGVEAEEYGISEIKVYYPGGSLAGNSMHIDGAPRFVEGEKNILLLNQKDDGRFWIQDLALGTFKVVRIGKQSVIINPVFPSHVELSQIPIEQFFRKVSQVKGVGLKDINSDKYVRELTKDQYRMVSASAGGSRSLASLKDPAVAKSEPNVLDSFWLVFILATLGVVAAWRSRRRAR